MRWLLSKRLSQVKGPRGGSPDEGGHKRELASVVKAKNVT